MLAAGTSKRGAHKFKKPQVVYEKHQKIFWKFS
jgi:hypothetical protein